MSNGCTYSVQTDISDTTTTRKSSKLNADRQNDPLCKMKPYVINLRMSSAVNITTKKQSRYFKVLDNHFYVEVVFIVKKIFEKLING